MKTKRTILIIVGWLCIFINTTGWLAVIAMPSNKYSPHGVSEVVGFNFWFALGFVLLFQAYRLKIKIKRKEEEEHFDAFLVENPQANPK